MPIAYDPSNSALYTPGQRPTVLQHGPLPALNALCAEASRLVYLPFEQDPAHRAQLDEALGRVGIGAELKPSYFRQAIKNVQAAAAGHRFDVQNGDLLADLEAEAA